MEGKRIIGFFVTALLSLLAGLGAIGREYIYLGVTLMLVAIGLLLWLVFKPGATGRGGGCL